MSPPLGLGLRNSNHNFVLAGIGDKDKDEQHFEPAPRDQVPFDLDAVSRQVKMHHHIRHSMVAKKIPFSAAIPSRFVCPDCDGSTLVYKLVHWNAYKRGGGPVEDVRKCLSQRRENHLAFVVWTLYIDLAYNQGYLNPTFLYSS